MLPGPCVLDSKSASWKQKYRLDLNEPEGTQAPSRRPPSNPTVAISRPTTSASYQQLKTPEAIKLQTLTP